MTEFNELYLTLSMDMSERLGEETSQPDGSTSRTIPILRYVDDTAVLIVTSFMSGTEEQIYNDDKTISDTAYQYDTFYFVQRAMQAIKAYEAEGHSIENVVLDLTLNSGGSLAAMTGVIGCMTDLPVVYPRADLLSDRFSIDYYLTDADGDGDYKDADAYDEYDWYVLTSPLTFSAANFLASVVQDMGVATVIGEQSAGGTCALLTIVLPDGATTNISGALHVMQSPVYEQGVIVGGEMIEDGITPDILLDRQSFYDNTALIEAIHNAKQ